MSKKRKPFEAPRSVGNSSSDSSTKPKTASIKKQKTGFFADPGVRETIESIVIAVILALLFRAYEAEAFVIPTGSMAPTLQGRHVDIFCEECGYNFRVGASLENPDRVPLINQDGVQLINPSAPWITATATCPICRKTHELDRNIKGSKTNQDSFYGDRIIVSKFAYEIANPKRWDVIVFKYPKNPKQNYIKRLIGLPGETIKLEFGDVLVRNSQNEFVIARKPHYKLKTMLQKVDDTHHIATSLKKAGWPSRWNEWSSGQDKRSWTIQSDGKHPQYQLSSTDSTKWLRYRHIVPREQDWQEYLSKGALPPRLKQFKGQLITDFYAYNCFQYGRIRNPDSVEDLMSLTYNPEGRYLQSKMGVHWVKDLALECELEVSSKSGEIVLDIVQSGSHFYCTIDVESGIATLTTNDSQIAFASPEKGSQSAPTAKTPIRGKGKYRIRYANADNKLYLWVNEKIIRFDEPTEYVHIQQRYPHPKYSADDPGDAEPIGVGGNGIELQVNRLQVLRDIYYINTRDNTGIDEYRGYQTSQPDPYRLHDAEMRANPLRTIFEDPAKWDSPNADAFFTSLIHNDPRYFFPLEKDQFMPLGDNSPSSMDARAWTDGHYFHRKYLIGKALFIYWPHAWRQPFFFPNFRRIGFIR